MTELIEGIDLVKMYAWDEELQTHIQEQRKKELNELYKINDFQNYVRGFFSGSVLIALISILLPWVLIA